MVTKIKYLLSVIVFFSFSLINAQKITVFALTDTTDYKVGDYISYSLQLSYPKSAQIFLPSVKDSVKVLDFIKELPVKKSENNGIVSEVHNYIFSKYDSANVTIP